MAGKLPPPCLANRPRQILRVPKREDGRTDLGDLRVVGGHGESIRHNGGQER
jgi:hypothetical protein